LFFIFKLEKSKGLQAGYLGYLLELGPSWRRLDAKSVTPKALPLLAQLALARTTIQIQTDRGGGTSGVSRISAEEKLLAAYSNRTNGGGKEIVRGAQIMSIFGASN
jgi:hypothetical protein